MITCFTRIYFDKFIGEEEKGDGEKN